MTQIDFYILSAQQPEERLSFACRLAEKAYKSQCKVHIQVDNQTDSDTLSQHLWQSKAESFIPHFQLDSDQQPAPISIGHGDLKPDQYDVLINLASDIPNSFSRYSRVLEIVIQHDGILTATRQHYGFFKHRGYAINNIDMRVMD